MALIEAQNLQRAYPGAMALRGLDLSIERGEWVAVVGPSGSGKTTLLNILAGLDGPTAGHVVLDGQDLAGLSEDQLARLRRQKVGLVFQQSHLLPYLDAVENVMLAQFFHSTTDEAEAAAALERVGLGHRLHHRPSQMSGGERQRACIARALINQPDLLLADEPTGNLDRENTRQVLDTLRELRASLQFTIVVVTHDSFVAQQADRIITLEDGRTASDELVRR